MAKADPPLSDFDGWISTARHRWLGQSPPAQRFHYPGFNLIRVIAALAVVFSHSFLLYTGTESQEPFQRSTGEILGVYAVFVFFLLSGFLITDSALNAPSLMRFARNRARRILPAFVVSNILVVLVICPFYAKAGGQAFLTDPETWKGLLRILTFQDAILKFSTVEFTHEPGAGEPGLWVIANGVLWTIRIELTCYLLVGVMAALRLLRPIPVLMLFAVSFILLMKPIWPATPFFNALAYLLPSFAAGMYLRVNAYGHVAHGYMALSSSVVLILSMTLLHSWAGLAALLFPILFGYPLLWLGQRGKPGAQQDTGWNDPSYGIYIWGWPVQQVLAAAIGPGMPTYAFAALCILAATIAGYVSWFTVERPFLHRRKPRRGPDARPYRVGTGTSPR